MHACVHVFNGLAILSVLKIKAEYAHALKGLALPRASHSNEIAFCGTHVACVPCLRLRQSVDTVTKIDGTLSPNCCIASECRPSVYGDRRKDSSQCGTQRKRAHLLVCEEEC